MSDSESDIVAALASAAAYRAFSLAFQSPTDARLREAGADDGFAALADALRYLDPASSGDYAACVDRLRTAGRRAEVLAADYWRVFGHTTRGLVCACETEYGDDNGFQQPQQLADIAGFYLAFGLTPPSASDERPDHVACECEFMEFLNLKQARFIGAADRTAEAEETLAVTRQAVRSFLRDHLGRFGRAFASRLTSEDTGPYYGAWGALFLLFLDGECRRAGVEGGPNELALRPEAVDDTPMACGPAGDLIQIQRRP